jgi:hypothetical protein
MKKNKIPIWYNKVSSKRIFVAMAIATIVLLFIIFHTPKFNPSTDVCDNEYSFGYPMNSKPDVLSNCYNIHISNERIYHDDITMRATCCKSWHPKNKCEISPEAEGCVCEYILNTSINLAEKTCGFDEQIVEYSSHSIKYNCSIPVYQNSSNCIKSHLRTLADLSCSELLDYYENGNQCLKVNSMFCFTCRSCDRWKYPVIEYTDRVAHYLDYSDKQIFSEMWERCK